MQKIGSFDLNTEMLNTEMDNWSGRIEYLPTPGEIAAACEAIRTQWTRCERRRRFVGDLVPDDETRSWEPPVIDTSVFRISAGRGVGDLIS